MSGRMTLYVILLAAVVTATVLTATVASLPQSPVSAYTSDTERRNVVIPELTAEAWGVFDPETGRITHGSDARSIRPIASITKLFTACAVVTLGKEDVPATITWSDLNTEGESGKLTYGSETTLGELLFPLLLESSNDAGAAIARILGGELDSEITSLTKRATLTSTRISDATGLDPRSVSSVEDLAHLYPVLRDECPHVLDITQLHKYLYGEVGLVNNDPARAFSTFNGGKHGYTPEAGKTFVGTFTLQSGAQRSEIGIVLLGTQSIEADIRAVLEAFEGIPRTEEQ